MEEIPNIFPKSLAQKDFSMRCWSLEVTTFGSRVHQEETIEWAKSYLEFNTVMSIQNSLEKALTSLPPSSFTYSILVRPNLLMPCRLKVHSTSFFHLRAFGLEKYLYKVKCEGLLIFNHCDWLELLSAFGLQHEAGSLQEFFRNSNRSIIQNQQHLLG